MNSKFCVHKFFNRSQKRKRGAIVNSQGEEKRACLRSPSQQCALELLRPPRQRSAQRVGSPQERPFLSSSPRGIAFEAIDDEEDGLFFFSDLFSSDLAHHHPPRRLAPPRPRRARHPPRRRSSHGASLRQGRYHAEFSSSGDQRGGRARLPLPDRRGHSLFFIFSFFNAPLQAQDGSVSYGQDDAGGRGRSGVK